MRFVGECAIAIGWKGHWKTVGHVVNGGTVQMSMGMIKSFLSYPPTRGTRVSSLTRSYEAHFIDRNDRERNSNVAQPMRTRWPFLLLPDVYGKYQRPTGPNLVGPAGPGAESIARRAGG